MRVPESIFSLDFGGWQGGQALGEGSVQRSTRPRQERRPTQPDAKRHTKNLLVAMEERVHPIPFRTWKLSSPSPMILHNVMWESRPLSTIAPKPLAATSARGFVVYPPPCIPPSSRPSRLPASLPLPHATLARPSSSLLHSLPLPRNPLNLITCSSARACQPHLRKPVFYTLNASAPKF